MTIDDIKRLLGFVEENYGRELTEEENDFVVFHAQERQLTKEDITNLRRKIGRR
jgi:hypothetical protein